MKLSKETRKLISINHQLRHINTCRSNWTHYTHFFVVVCHHHSGLPSSQPKVYFLNSQHDSCEPITVNLSQKRDSSTNPNVATGIPTFAQGIHLLPAKLCNIEKWYHQFLVGEDSAKFKRESHRVTYDSPLIFISIHCKMWIYRDMYCILSYRSPAAVSRNLCPENPAATKWDPNKISWALEVGFSPNFSKFAVVYRPGTLISSVLWFEFCKKITSLAQDQSGSNDAQWMV